MPQKALLNKPNLTHSNSLKTLVENRTIYNLKSCELNLFETYQKADLVSLKFNDIVVTSMLRGKKVMHLYNDPEFEYLPGETVILPSNVEMQIDFPEATFDNPTQCLALTIDSNKIKETLNLLNEKYPKEGENNYWSLDFDNYFFHNDLELATNLNKLLKECMSNSLSKDILADLSLQELIVRIIQSQTYNAYKNDKLYNINSPIHPVLEYIRQNIHLNFNLKELSDKAFMSPISFYRYFKRETGVSPMEYILSEKVKFAKYLLNQTNKQVSEIGFMIGIEDANYFIRIFKKFEGITPKQYQILKIDNQNNSKMILNPK